MWNIILKIKILQVFLWKQRIRNVICPSNKAISDHIHYSATRQIKLFLKYIWNVFLKKMSPTTHGLREHQNLSYSALYMSPPVLMIEVSKTNRIWWKWCFINLQMRWDHKKGINPFLFAFWMLKLKKWFPEIFRNYKLPVSCHTERETISRKQFKIDTQCFVMPK